MYHDENYCILNNKHEIYVMKPRVETHTHVIDEYNCFLNNNITPDITGIILFTSKISWNLLILNRIVLSSHLSTQFFFFFTSLFLCTSYKLFFFFFFSTRRCSSLFSLVDAYTDCEVSTRTIGPERRRR